MKLLLVDDDEDQLSLRGLTLARAGHDIFTAGDVKTAVQVASEQRPQVAIVDLRIPTEEAGLRLMRALKNVDADLRLIVLTGVDAKHFETLPERKLVEAVMTKGTGSRQLVEHLKDSGAFNLRKKLAAEGQLVLDVKVIPRSSRSEVVEFSEDGSLKVRLRATPEQGRANEELISLLAHHFEVRKDAIELLTGETSQRKRLCIRGTRTT